MTSYPRIGSPAARFRENVGFRERRWESPVTSAGLATWHLMTTLMCQLVLSSFVVSCTVSRMPPERRPPPETAMPTRVFDFAETELASVPIPVPDRSAGLLHKASIRAAIGEVQANLVRCANAAPHPAGTIGVTLQLSDDEGETSVDAATVAAFGDRAIELCMEAELMSIELPPMEAPAIWNVNYPFTVRANR